MAEEDLSGKIIEGYHVIKPIGLHLAIYIYNKDKYFAGQGKFATVYKAETKDNKVVALKKIKVI